MTSCFSHLPSSIFHPRLRLCRALETVRFLLPILLLLFAPLFLFAAPAPPKPSLPIPPATNILARLKPGHPRLLASEQDFAILKERLAHEPLLQSWHSKLQTQAEQILTNPPSRYEIPDGLRLLATSRRVATRVQTLGLLYRLDPQPRYAERMWQELSAAAAFTNWNPRHFLDTAEMTGAFALGYDWLYDVWTPDQRATLRRAIVEKGFTPALPIYRKHTWWASAKHNWNQVCNGGIGLGALALADVEPELAGELLHDALESIQIPMAEFAPDGAWQEGPGYWDYATTYNVLFLAAAETALKTDFGLSQMKAFSDTGLFPIYLTGPLGRTFNYADGGDHHLSAPQMFWFARKFHQPAYAAYERQSAEPAALDLLWFEPGDIGPKAAHLPLDKYFRGSEIALLRSEWENPQALFAGFKAGDNKANHSHLDLGSFVFDALGVRWAMDLGSDNYNLPAYFGKQRWTYYRLRAEGQNTLVLNPDAGPDQDPSAAARIFKFDSRPERAFAIADLTPAYKQHARKVWRGLALLDRNKLLVQDEIQATKPADVWWFMHTPAGVKIENDGRTATLQQSRAQLRVQLLSPEGARFQLMDAQPLPSSPHPEHQAKNEKFRKLAIHLSGIAESRIAVLLIPVPPDGTRPVETLTLSPLSAW
jgi:hypothetical protein